MKQFKIDQYWEFSFNTQRFDTGAATDADATPTYRVYESDTDSGVNETVVQSGDCAKTDDANTTGYYHCRAQATVAAGYEVGKTYEVRVAATVNSVAGAAVIGRFAVVPVVVWDSMFGGTDTLDVATISIANDAITAAAIAAGAIDAAAFAAGAINAAAIAADAIELAKIKDGAISAAKFAANAITSTVVADNTITANKINADAITAAKIADGAIDAATFAANAITNAAVADDVDVNLKTSTAGVIAAAVWSADATSYQTAGTFGQAIGDPGADTNSIFKAVVTDAGLATVGLDVVEVLTRVPDATAGEAGGLFIAGVNASCTITDVTTAGSVGKYLKDILDDTAVLPATWVVPGVGTSTLTTTDVQTYCDAAITANTLVKDLPTNSELGTALTNAFATAWSTTTIAEDYPADTAAGTPAELLYLILSCVSQFDITTTEITTRKLDGTTAAAVYTLDSATVPTSRTRKATP